MGIIEIKSSARDPGSRAKICVYSKDSSCWYAVTVIVKKKDLISALQRFRKLNASSLSVSKPYYIFQNKSKAVVKLLGNS